MSKYKIIENKSKYQRSTSIFIASKAYCEEISCGNSYMTGSNENLKTAWRALDAGIFNRVMDIDANEENKFLRRLKLYKNMPWGPLVEDDSINKWQQMDY